MIAAGFGIFLDLLNSVIIWWTIDALITTVMIGGSGGDICHVLDM
jgi:hypothetical protein